MISQLRGTIISKDPALVVLDVHGVGYELAISLSTYAKLGEINTPLTLYTRLIVREDAHLLFGFFEERERSLFLSLIKVTGIGPKLALTILSSVEPNRFLQCLQDNDSAALVKIPGIGAKTAARLIVELKNTLDPDWSQGSSARPGQSASQEAISALVSLGYKPQEASRAVTSVATPEQNCEIIIREALRYLAA